MKIASKSSRLIANINLFNQLSDPVIFIEKALSPKAWQSINSPQNPNSEKLVFKRNLAIENFGSKGKYGKPKLNTYFWQLKFELNYKKMII